MTHTALHQQIQPDVFAYFAPVKLRFNLSVATLVYENN